MVLFGLNVVETKKMVKGKFYDTIFKCLILVHVKRADKE